MAVNLSPIGNDAPFVDASGNPLSGGLLYTYLAGSSTTQATYTTQGGSTANANPVVLNANGYPASAGNVVEIWLTAGTEYKFTLKTSGGVEVWTRDDISGINDATANTLSPWIDNGFGAPTYIGATQFSVVGDATGTFNEGLRIKALDGATTLYGYVSAASFGGGITTVTAVLDSGSFTAGLSDVDISVLDSDNQAVPWTRANGVAGIELRGTPLAPTATAGTNTTQIASTAFVKTAIGVAGLVPGLGRNVGASVTLTANELVFAVKDAAGSDPSATSPVSFSFQSATITTGTESEVAVTAPLAITIPAGATVGSRSGFPSRIYFGVLDNGGTGELCFWNGITTGVHPNSAFAATLLDVTNIFTVLPNNVYSTTANSVNADSSGVVYSTSARSSKRIIPIAYVDSTQTTAGTWAQAITRLTLLGSASPKTGEIVGEVIKYDGALATGTSVVPLDDTIPDHGGSAEGDVYMTQAYTFANTYSIIDLEFVGNFANSAATDGFVAFLAWNPGTSQTLAVQAGNIVAAGDQIELVVRRTVQFFPISTITIEGIAGGSAAGTTTFNGRSGGRLYGGAMGSYLRVREISA